MLAGINKVVFLIRHAAHVRQTNRTVIHRAREAHDEKQEGSSTNKEHLLAAPYAQGIIGHDVINRLCRFHHAWRHAPLPLPHAFIMVRNSRAQRRPQKQEEHRNVNGRKREHRRFDRPQEPIPVWVKLAKNRTCQKEQENARMQKQEKQAVFHVEAAMQQVTRKKRKHRSKGDDRIVRQYSRRK